MSATGSLRRARVGALEKVMARSGALMVCGTTSDAGKSTVVAGLCRLLAREGVSVAPFKGQNMSLNSVVTTEGAEIGRAQWLQAVAAGAEPEAAMNPVLLKPTGERSSQVIVMGRPLETREAADYQRSKVDLVGIVDGALADLRSRFDVVICEGAGSPAEINLLDHDIVNLGLAAACRHSGRRRRRHPPRWRLRPPLRHGGPVARGAPPMRQGVHHQHVPGRPGTARQRHGTNSRNAVASRRLACPALSCPDWSSTPRTPCTACWRRSVGRVPRRGGGAARRGRAPVAPPVELHRLWTPSWSKATWRSVSWTTLRPSGTPTSSCIPGTKSTMADLAWLATSGLRHVVVAAAPCRPHPRQSSAYAVASKCWAAPSRIPTGWNPTCRRSRAWAGCRWSPGSSREDHPAAGRDRGRAAPRYGAMKSAMAARFR